MDINSTSADPLTLSADLLAYGLGADLAGIDALTPSLGAELKAFAKARGFSGAAILVANEGQLSYQTDRNENGTIDAGETITYALNGDELVRGNVLPFVAAAAPQVARNIDALNFDYFDANGNNIADKSVTPWVVPLNQIASIQVSIVARAGNTIPVGFTRVTDVTQYRNRSGDIIFGPANDVFRRMQVTTDIDCRN